MSCQRNTTSASAILNLKLWRQNFNFNSLRLRMPPCAYAYHTCKQPCAYACAYSYACVVRVNQPLATTTATATKPSLENVTSRNLYYFAIIPIRSTCTMWAKYPGNKFMGTAFKYSSELRHGSVSSFAQKARGWPIF